MVNLDPVAMSVAVRNLSEMLDIDPRNDVHSWSLRGPPFTTVLMSHPSQGSLQKNLLAFRFFPVKRSQKGSLKKHTQIWKEADRLSAIWRLSPCVNQVRCILRLNRAASVLHGVSETFRLLSFPLPSRHCGQRRSSHERRWRGKNPEEYEPLKIWGSKGWRF